MKAAAIIYSATVSAGNKGQQWMPAVALLREMQQWQMKAAGITYSATISACKKGQHGMPAAALLRAMQQWHVEPNAITYNATISACEKGQGEANPFRHDLAPGDAAVVC